MAHVGAKRGCADWALFLTVCSTRKTITRSRRSGLQDRLEHDRLDHRKQGRVSHAVSPMGANAPYKSDENPSPAASIERPLIISLICSKALPLCRWAVTGSSITHYSVNTLSQSAEQPGPCPSASRLPKPKRVSTLVKNIWTKLE